MDPIIITIIITIITVQTEIRRGKEENVINADIVHIKNSYTKSL